MPVRTLGCQWTLGKRLWVLECLAPGRDQIVLVLCPTDTPV